MNMRLPAAVLWDYDSTLVNTQPVWLSVEEDILASYGKVWTTELAAAAVGTSGLAAAHMMIDAIGDQDLTVEQMEERRGRMVAERVASSDLSFMPGARELLTSCRESGIPCALCSASPRYVLEAGLTRMDGWFGAVVSADDVVEHKPAPDGYLRAASLLGVDIHDCLVIEDSEPGTAAGRAAGAAVLAVSNVSPLEPRPGQVRRDSLEGLDAADLAEIVEQARMSLTR